MATGVGLLGVKFLGLQPNVSSTTWDRRFLTSMVMLPCPSDLRGWTYEGWLSQRWRPWQEVVWLLHQGWWDINFQVDRLACSKTYAAGQWLQYGGYNGFVAPIQTYGIDDFGASDEELVDLQLADLTAGDCLCPSLR